MRRLAPRVAPVVIAIGLLLLSTAGAMAAEGGERYASDLPAGAIVGLVLSFVIAGLVLLLSLGYILPKPPGR